MEAEGDGRFLDEEALLTTLAYVDLNVMAAGMAKTPEELAHTSVKARVEHCREQGILDDIVNQPSDRTRRDTTPEDESFWLVPIQDRRDVQNRRDAGDRSGAGGGARVGDTGYIVPGQRAGMSAHMSLASYLRLLDWSSRLFRPGKARIPVEVANILERLGSSADLWHQRLKKLRETERLYGVVFAVSRESVNRFADSKGLSRLANTTG